MARSTGLLVAIVGCLLSGGVAAEPAQEKLWVFGDKEIKIIDPLDPNDTIYKTIPVVEQCAGDCNFGYPGFMGESVVITHYNFGRPGQVMVFDATTGDLKANLKTCNLPLRLDFAPWRSEVYIHCWFRPEDWAPGSPEIEDGIVDVLNTQDLGLKYPWIDAVHTTGYLHGFIALTNALPEFAFSANKADPGIHVNTLATREGKFVSLKAEGCNAVDGLAVSSANKHGFVKCRNENPFVMELNLDGGEVKVVQKMRNGMPHVTKDGRYIVLMDSSNDELHVYKAGANGASSQFDQSVSGITGFSKLEFVESETAHVAIVTSVPENKVLLVNMNNLSDKKIVDLPDLADGASTAEVGAHGQTRQVSTGVVGGNLVACISAQLNETVHVINMGDGSDIQSASVSPDLDIKDVKGSSHRMLIVQDEEDPDVPLTERTTASDESVKQLQARVTALEEGVWGAQLSDSFWVFAEDGLHVIDAKLGEKKHTVGSMELCDGSSCSWGYPETDGSSYVVVADLGNSEVLAFDIHTGGLLAKVKTCNSPYMIDLAPWRSEIYVHCWSRPDEDSTEKRDGVVDTLSTTSWSVKNPLVDAIYSSEGYFHGDIFTSPAMPEFAWSTNYVDPGVHKITLGSKQSNFVNLEGAGCTGVSDLAISATSHHGYVSCFKGSFRQTFVLEINLKDDTVVQELPDSGTPYTTKDGKYMIIMDKTNHKLHIYEAKANGVKSTKDREVEDEIEGFSQLDFAEREGDVHVAVVSSLSQNKVMLVDMEDMTSRTVELPDPHGNSTAKVGAHGAQRALATGVLADGRLVAMVSAQFLETVHVIDMGIGANPITAAEVKYDIEEVPGSSPKLLFVPMAQKMAQTDVVRQRTASVGLVDAARKKIREVETSSSQTAQELSSLQTSMSSDMQSINSKMQQMQSSLSNAQSELSSAQSELQSLRSKVAEMERQVNNAQESNTRTVQAKISANSDESADTIASDVNAAKQGVVLPNDFGATFSRNSDRKILAADDARALIRNLLQAAVAKSSQAVGAKLADFTRVQGTNDFSVDIVLEYPESASAEDMNQDAQNTGRVRDALRETVESDATFRELMDARSVELLGSNTGGSSSGSDSDDDARPLAIAGIVLACVAIAAALVLAVAVIKISGNRGRGPFDCVQTSKGSFNRLEEQKLAVSEYTNPVNVPIIVNGANKV